MCNRYYKTRAEIIALQWDLGEPVTGDKIWRPGSGPVGKGRSSDRVTGSPNWWSAHGH